MAKRRRLLPQSKVAHSRSLDSVIAYDEAVEPVKWEKRDSPRLRSLREESGQLQRVADGVGHSEGAKDPWVEHRFALTRFGHGQLLGRHIGGSAPAQPCLDERWIIAWSENEKPPRIIDRMGRDAPQDRVLLDALSRGLGVGDDVARPRVKQAVIAPARSARQVAHL
ncbi:MAG: hypothetical protein NT005_00325, partial [Spirochaetes bacterium]|nr:hypothetical protein [Spirochaetota bacterium]